MEATTAAHIPAPTRIGPTIPVEGPENVVWCGQYIFESRCLLEDVWQGPPDSRDGRKTVGGHDIADNGAFRFVDRLALENDKRDGSRSEARM